MKHRSESGFTLIELLIAMALASIVGALIATAFSSYQASFSKQNQIAAMIQDVGGSFYLMEREIRLAGYDPRHSAGAGIVVANNSTITFTADIGGDGDINGTERITYSLLDQGDDRVDLVRTTDAPGAVIETVARYIDTLNFTYLDSDGDGEFDIVAIEIEGRTQREALERTKRLVSRVVLRNLRL